MRTCLGLFILTVSICWLSVEAHPATSTQSYLFKNSVLKSQPTHYAPFLLAQQSQESTAVKNMGSLKLKSPYMAVFFSVIPGVVFHGAGHLYAVESNTATLLFSAELAGVLVTYFAFLSAFKGDEYEYDTDILALGGLALFSGSWAYDIIGSPIAVKRQNRKLLQNSNTELKFQLKDRDLRLAIVWHF